MKKKENSLCCYYLYAEEQNRSLLIYIGYQQNNIRDGQIMEDNVIVNRCRLGKCRGSFKPGFVLTCFRLTREKYDVLKRGKIWAKRIETVKWHHLAFMSVIVEILKRSLRMTSMSSLTNLGCYITAVLPQWSKILTFILIKCQK